jgi:hypothetical protein
MDDNSKQINYDLIRCEAVLQDIITAARAAYGGPVYSVEIVLDVDEETEDEEYYVTVQTAQGEPARPGDTLEDAVTKLLAFLRAHRHEEEEPA